jgi:hypothetical protein
MSGKRYAAAAPREEIMFDIRTTRSFPVTLLALAALALAALPQGAQAMKLGTITYTGLEAALTMSDDPFSANRIASLLVDSTRYGPGGFALGEIQVGANPPDDGLWLTDPFGGVPPDDTMPAVSFRVNSADEVSGVDPTPFRLFAAARDRTVIGELDFSAVEGTLGSLNLSGVVVREVDANGGRTGNFYDVDPFTIRAVPLPAAAWLFGGALLALAGFARRQPATDPRAT